MPSPVKNRNDLNVRYCQAFGVDIDVEQYAGFRLTVLTEHLPVLEVFDMSELMPDGGWKVERYVLCPPVTNGPVDPYQLNVEFCQAFGVDTMRHAGFRLTVLGGELPALEAFVLPPTVDGGLLSDEHAVALEALAGRFSAEAPDSVVAMDAADVYDVVPEAASEPAPERHSTPVTAG